MTNSMREWDCCRVCELSAVSNFCLELNTKITKESTTPDKFSIRRRLGSVLLVENDLPVSHEEDTQAGLKSPTGRTRHGKTGKTIPPPKKSKASGVTAVEFSLEPPQGSPELPRSGSSGITSRNRWVSTRIKDPAMVSALATALTSSAGGPLKPPPFTSGSIHLSSNLVSNSGPGVPTNSNSAEPYMPSLSVRHKSKRGRTSLQEIFDPDGTVCRILCSFLIV